MGHPLQPHALWRRVHHLRRHRRDRLRAHRPRGGQRHLTTVAGGAERETPVRTLGDLGRLAWALLWSWLATLMSGEPIATLWVYPRRRVERLRGARRR